MPKETGRLNAARDTRQEARLLHDKYEKEARPLVDQYKAMRRAKDCPMLSVTSALKP